MKLVAVNSTLTASVAPIGVTIIPFVGDVMLMVGSVPASLLLPELLPELPPLLLPLLLPESVPPSSAPPLLLPELLLLVLLPPELLLLQPT